MDSCNGNVLSRNVLIMNQLNGIFLSDECDGNILSDNIAELNTENGIYIHDLCDTTTISNNDVNDNTHNGLYLKSGANTNTISSNNFINNTLIGIRLESECDNNVIMDNSISGNKYGIYIVENSDSNDIYLNFLSDNTICNGWDDKGNDWESPFFGNWWSDYAGFDINHDGIGGIPHPIPGGGGAYDNLPLLHIYEPYFTVLADDLSYEIGTTGNILVWNVLFPIAGGITISTTYDIVRDGKLTDSGHSWASEEDIIVNIDGLDEGHYIFRISVFDSYGGNISNIALVSVQNTAPVFTTQPEDFSYVLGTTGNNLTWTFADISINNPTYSIIVDGLTISSDIPCVSGENILIPIDGFDIGTYTFTIEIADGFGKTVSSIVWISVTEIPETGLGPTTTGLLIGTIVGGVGTISLLTLMLIKLKKSRI
ncbi:MAG: right-handed parallel beta-helix repeat-containing protein [Promethearchaeota archaeon]